VILAHVGGMPVEELLLPVLGAVGALTTGVGAWISVHRRERHRERRRSTNA
jgi:hypothetical protein